MSDSAARKLAGCRGPHVHTATGVALPGACAHWPAGPRHPDISANEVQLWAAELDLPKDSVRHLSKILSPAERARRDAFATPALRQRFTVARARLRTVLAGYLGIDPRQIRLVTTDDGKPKMVPPVLHFNVSHSGGLVLIGVRAEGPIGVDLERIEPIADLWNVLRAVASPAELSSLRGGNPEDLLAGFYRLWTRKEALVKATGQGLSCPLQTVEVTTTRSRCRVVAIAGNAAAASPWQLAHVDLGAEYVGAIATFRNTPPEIRSWWHDIGDWTGS